MMDMMRKFPAILLLLACTGCPEGERCDMATYKGGCDGDRGMAHCSDKTHTGMKKLWPTVSRRECQSNTVCFESGEVATCVAEPAESCDVVDSSRCVDGMLQKCWDVDARTKNSGVLYWYLIGTSCD